MSEQGKLLSDEERAEIRARLESATPRPWMYCRDPHHVDDVRVCQDDGNGACICCLALMGNTYDETQEWTQETIDQWNADAEFIAASREAIPRLLHDVEVLRAELSWYGNDAIYEDQLRQYAWASDISIDRGRRARKVLGIED